MKDLKDIILEKRIRKLEVDGKEVPSKYLVVFNDYIEEIAETLADYTKQVRKEVCEEIRELSIKRNSDQFYISIQEILDKVSGVENE